MPVQPEGEVPLKSPSALRFLRSLSLSHCLSQLHRRINGEKASKFGFLLLAWLKNRLSSKRTADCCSGGNQGRGWVTSPPAWGTPPWVGYHQSVITCGRGSNSCTKARTAWSAHSWPRSSSPDGNVAVPGHTMLFQERGPASQEGMSSFM